MHPFIYSCTSILSDDQEGNAFGVPTQAIIRVDARSGTISPQYDGAAVPPILLNNQIFPKIFLNLRK